MPLSTKLQLLPAVSRKEVVNSSLIDSSSLLDLPAKLELRSQARTLAGTRARGSAGRLVAVGLPFLLGLLAVAHSAEEADSDWVYLENASLRLGVKRSSGAGLAYLAEAGSNRNLLDHFDRGRLVQQSYYGDSDGSLWGQQPWRYNPVQGGEYRGQGARVVELQHNEASIYARTVPRHWATGAELPECVMEEWITLEGNLAHLRLQFTYHGVATHAPRHQEIPAIFCIPALGTLVTYEGSTPWQGASLSRLHPGAKNEYYQMREHWAAFVDSDEKGLGAYVPVASELTCYRYTAAGSECSYLAPLTTFALTPGLVFKYDAYLSIGTVAELRERFTALHAGENPAK